MKNSLNILHYSIYRMHYTSHLIANKVNPFRLIHRLPFLKRKYETEGIDILKETDKAFRDERFGLSVITAGGILTAVLFLFLVGLGSLGIKAVGIEVAFKYLLIAMGLFSYIMCYILVFKKDGYLEYFRIYRTWSKRRTRINIIISLLFIFFAIILFYAGLLTEF